MHIRESATHSITSESANPPLPGRDVRRKRPLLHSVLWRKARQRVVRVALLLGLDGLGVFGALVAALYLELLLKGDRDYSLPLQQARHWGVFAYLITALMFARVHLYADRASRPGMIEIATALFQAAVISLVFALASGQRFSSYYLFYGSLGFATLFVTALREVHLRASAWVLRRSGYRLRAVVIGSGEHADIVARALSDRSRTDVDVIDSATTTTDGPKGSSASGPVSDLARVMTLTRVDEVILAEPGFPQDKTIELVDLCQRAGVLVHVAPTTMSILMERAEFLPGQPVPLFTLQPPQLRGIERALKRSVDLAVSGALLLVFAPVFGLVAIVRKLTLSGPVFERTLRDGAGGKCFVRLTFSTIDRTSLGELGLGRRTTTSEPSGVRERISMSLGNLLWSCRIDALPLLINVMRGEMSLVGTRPLTRRDPEGHPESLRRRAFIAPGLTGLWRLSSHAQLSSEELTRLDFVYVGRWSLLLDLVIVLRTVPALLRRRAAVGVSHGSTHDCGSPPPGHPARSAAQAIARPPRFPPES